MKLVHSKQVTVIETVIETDTERIVEYWSADGALRVGQFSFPLAGTKPELKVVEPEPSTV